MTRSYAYSYWFAVVLPPVGIVLAIVALARNDIGPGLAILLLAVASGVGVYLVLSNSQG